MLKGEYEQSGLHIISDPRFWPQQLEQITLPEDGHNPLPLVLHIEHLLFDLIVLCMILGYLNLHLHIL